MPLYNSFTVYNLKSSSILSRIILNAVNFPDDGGRPSDACFGIRFSKLDRHEWYLPSAATKSLKFKLKVKSLNHMSCLKITLS